MSYEPYTWKQSEVITSSGLNHIESGISQLDSDSTNFNERLNKVESNISVIQSKQAEEKEEVTTDDFEFVSGDFGLRVSKTGIQRTYDGGTTWINI